MKHRILAIAACLIVAVSLSACAGMGSGGMPGLENRITDIGNPNEEAPLLATKGIYINREFEVRIDYPLRWNLEERSTHEAFFHSNKGEAITASFVELEQGESLESFLAEVHSDDSDLIDKNHPDFDRSVCANNELVGGMIAIECYYYRADADRSFVMTFTGVSLNTEDAPTVAEFTVVGVATKDASDDSGPEMSGMTPMLNDDADYATTLHLYRPVIKLMDVETGPATTVHLKSTMDELDKDKFEEIIPIDHRN